MEPLEVLGVSVGVLGLLGGLMAWMFKVGRDVGSIAEAVKGIKVLWDRVDDHGERLDDHGQRIGRLEGKVDSCDD